MAVSKRLRFEIFRRDNHTCQYCGRSAPDVQLTIDHVIPVTLGGTDDPSNLRTACTGCNSGKSSIPADAALVEEVSAQALKFAEAVKQVAEMRSQEITNRLELTRWFMSVWNSWTNWRDETYDTEGDEMQSIPQFISLGLTRADLDELVGVAMRSRATDKWRYFCGCCWRRIRDTQQQAAEIMAGQRSDQTESVALTTVWTPEDIDEYATHPEGSASRWLSANAIASTHCPHRDWGEGHCGDPVCRVQRAEALSWMTDRMVLNNYRDDDVMDAADEAEGYVYG